MRALVKFFRFIAKVLSRFYRDDCTYRATTLAYTSLLSIVPLMTVALAIFSVFPVFTKVSQQVQHFLVMHLVATSAHTIESHLARFVVAASKLSFINTVMLLLLAIIMLYALEQNFNAIWRVQHNRNFFKAFILYWAILTLIPLLLGGSIIISSYLFSLPVLNHAVMITKLQVVALPLILNVCAFTFIYFAIPHCRVSIKAAFVSGLFSGAAFELAKKGFSFYIRHFKVYQLIYGAIAVLPLFLIWIYVCWLIILLGAELCYLIDYGRKSYVQNKLDPFTHALLWLMYFFHAQQLGRSLTVINLIQKNQCAYQIPPQTILQVLQDAKLVAAMRGHKYILCRDLENLTIGELIELLPWRLPTLATLQAYQQQDLQDFIGWLEKYQQQTEKLFAQKVVGICQARSTVKYSEKMKM